jgi:hypothetical protein
VTDKETTMSTERINDLLHELADLLVEKRRIGLLVHAGTEGADSTVQLFGDGGDEAHERLARAVVHGLQRLGTTGRRAALGLPQWMQARVAEVLVDESERDHLILCKVKLDHGVNALWLGPNRSGHTEALKQAGRYTRAEAERICARASLWACDRPVPLAEALRAAVTVVDLGRLEAGDCSDDPGAREALAKFWA